MSHVFLTWLISLFLISCAVQKQSPVSSLPTLQLELEKQYPANQFVLAVGLSNLGFNEAEADAKRKIAEQIQSAFVSEMELSRQVVESEKASSVYSRLSSRSESRTSFSHAQLIHTMVAKGREIDGVHYVPAWLRRSDLAKLLWDQAGRISPVLTASQADALAAKNLLALYQPGSQADSTFSQLFGLAIQYRAVAKLELTHFAVFDSIQTAVLSHKHKMKLATLVESRVSITGTESFKAYSEGCQASISNFLSSKGLRIEKTRPDCEPCLTAEVRVEPRLDSNYRFGPQCKLNWEAKLVSQSSNSELFLARGKVISYSSHGEMDEAINKAWKQLADSVAGGIAVGITRVLKGD
jgi:hypothetical protein